MDSGRTSGTTTQTDTCSRHNPGKSQGRPNEKPGLEAHRANRPTRLRSPNEAPIPDRSTLRPDPDRASNEQFHAAKGESRAFGSSLPRRHDGAWAVHRSRSRASRFRCSTKTAVGASSIRASTRPAGAVPRPKQRASRRAARSQCRSSSRASAWPEPLGTPEAVEERARSAVWRSTTVCRLCSGSAWSRVRRRPKGAGRMQVIGVPAMILPKVRDPRFVTIRRGGTLTDADHQLLALWAASCAQHVLDLFESAQAEDPRPRQAIEHARAWVRGEVTMTQARTAARPCNGRGQRPAWGRTACRLRCWPGRGRTARRRARTRCGRVRDQGRTCRRAGRRGRRRRATRVPVAA
jgi:hypothetical protein